eukprot:366338-Chlamydomonas_euryale.AAC.8
MDCYNSGAQLMHLATGRASRHMSQGTSPPPPATKAAESPNRQPPTAHRISGGSASGSFHGAGEADSGPACVAAGRHGVRWTYRPRRSLIACPPRQQCMHSHGWLISGSRPAAHRGQAPRNRERVVHERMHGQQRAVRLTSSSSLGGSRVNVLHRACREVKIEPSQQSRGQPPPGRRSNSKKMNPASALGTR